MPFRKFVHWIERQANIERCESLEKPSAASAATKIEPHIIKPFQEPGAISRQGNDRRSKWCYFCPENRPDKVDTHETPDCYRLTKGIMKRDEVWRTVWEYALCQVCLGQASHRIENCPEKLSRNVVKCNKCNEFHCKFLGCNPNPTARRQ